MPATTTTAPVTSDTPAAAGGKPAKTKPFHKAPRYGEPELEQLKQVIEAFRANGGRDKPVYLQVHLSWDTDDAIARQSAWDQWRATSLDSVVLADLRLPHQFEAAAKYVSPSDMDASVRISADPRQHLDWIQQDLVLDLAGLILHNVGRNQRAFIETFGNEVLPELG